MPGVRQQGVAIANPRTWLVDRHVERAFRPRSDGTVAFYPFGRWLDGYRATTLQQEAVLRAAMRHYVLAYLRGGLLLVLAGAGILASKEFLVSAISGFSVWVLIVLSFVWSLAPLVGMAIFIGMWQRRFRNIACDLEVLPPTFTQLSRVQGAAARANRCATTIRAAVSFLVAISALVLMIWQEPRLDRWGTVVMACVVVAGLAYYVWCRAVLRAAQGSDASGSAEPAAPGDGKGCRAWPARRSA